MRLERTRQNFAILQYSTVPGVDPLFLSTKALTNPKTHDTYQLARFSSTKDVTLLHFSHHFFNERAFMRCEFRQGVLQRDLWARRSVSNPVPGVSISMLK